MQRTIDSTFSNKKDSRKNNAHKLAGTIDHRAAGIATNDIAGADEIERRLQIESRFALRPCGWQIESRDAAHFVGTLVLGGKRGERRDGLASFFVTLDRAESQAQRESGIGITRRAEQCITRSRDCRMRLLFHLTLIFRNLA